MSNNLTKTKMKKVENTQTEVKETKKDALRRLFKANGLVEEDVYKDKRGFVIITRSGIDKIVSKQNISVAYEPVVMEKEWVVMRATASMKTGNKETDVRNMMSFGEASMDNLMGGGKKFPVAMAEKRAMSRVVLKIGKPVDAEYWQIDFIDNLLPRTGLEINEQAIISNKIFEKGFSKQEAEELIIYLKQSEIKTDPKDQYQEFVKNGMFK